MPHDHGPVLQYNKDSTITLLTLAANTAILGPDKIDSSRLQGFHLIWVKIAGFFAGKTTADGPVMYGICCNLTASELTDILNDDPQSAQVVTKTGPGSWYMPITLIGLDSTEGDINGDGQSTEIQGTSKFTKYPVNWTIPEGNNFNTFAFNQEGGALATGMTIQTSVQAFGAWLRD